LVKDKRKMVVTIAVAFFGVLTEWFYIDYMLDRGLEDKTAALVIAQSNFPLVVLPALGAFLVLLASWNYAGGKILPIRSRPEARERNLSTWIRSAKVAMLIMAAFVSMLFLPYALWSSWFWQYLGRMGGAIGLYDGTAKMWQLQPLWKYVVSLNLSALFAAMVAIACGSRSSRIRKTR
jgi:hypothetical protein